MKRNVINNYEIDGYILHIINNEKVWTEEQKQWLKTTYSNWIKYAYEEDIVRVKKVSPTDPKWVTLEVLESQPVYRILIGNHLNQITTNIKDLLINNKNIKIKGMSVDKVLKLHHDWIFEINQVQAQLDEEVGDGKLIVSHKENPLNIVNRYTSGFYWYKLGAEDCPMEGRKMQNCIQSYASKVYHGHSTIYSLRDQRGNPHADVEIEKGGRTIQAVLKQNDHRWENSKYKGYIDSLLSGIKDKTIEHTPAVSSEKPSYTYIARRQQENPFKYRNTIKGKLYLLDNCFMRYKQGDLKIRQLSSRIRMFQKSVSYHREKELLNLLKENLQSYRQLAELGVVQKETGIHILKDNTLITNSQLGGLSVASLYVPNYLYNKKFIENINIHTKLVARELHVSEEQAKIICFIRLSNMFRPMGTNYSIATFVNRKTGEIRDEYVNDENQWRVIYHSVTYNSILRKHYKTRKSTVKRYTESFHKINNYRNEIIGACTDCTTLV